MIEHFLEVNYADEYSWEFEGKFPKVLEVGDVIETKLDFTPSKRQNDCVDDQEKPIETKAGDLVDCRCRVIGVVYSDVFGEFMPYVSLRLERIRHKKFDFIWVRVEDPMAWRSENGERDIVVTLSHEQTTENDDGQKRI